MDEEADDYLDDILHAPQSLMMPYIPQWGWAPSWASKSFVDALSGDGEHANFGEWLADEVRLLGHDHG